MTLPPVTFLRQADTHRLIPSEYHPTNQSVLLQLADGDDEVAEALRDLDGVTNDRLRSEHNQLPGINTQELVYGVSNYQVINAAFTHANPTGSRFNGPERGAWYAGFEFQTSLREVIHHRVEQYREIDRWDDSVTYDDYLADFSGEFHDLRQAPAFKKYLDPNSYHESQELAESLLDSGSSGIVYPSVRFREGTCLVCFRPAMVNALRRADAYRLTWNGGPEPEVDLEARAAVQRAFRNVSGV